MSREISREHQTQQPTLINIRFAGWSLLLSFWLSFFQAEARDFIYQNPFSEKLTEVQVQNKSRQTQPVWIVFYENQYVEEHYFEIPARSTQVLSLDGLKKPLWTFSILTKSNQVVPADSHWDLNATTRFEMKIKNFQFDLTYFNPFIEKQKIELSYFNARGEVLQKEEFVTASFRQNINRTEHAPDGATLLQIESEQPFLLSGSELFKTAVDHRRPASADFHYFLVQGGSDGTNFVVPMRDPELIQKAKSEIINPQGFIIFADVNLNSSQPNRNFASANKPYWSWSIEKVTGMAQIGADWCQAYPEMIERMLHQFVAQKHVCFRGQRIIRELKPSEVESGILNPSQ